MIAMSIEYQTQKVTVLREKNDQALIKIESSILVGRSAYKAHRYEWWRDIEMMKKGIHGDGTHIYCSGFAGGDEAELITQFDAENP